MPRYVPLFILIVVSVFLGLVLLKGNDNTASPLIGQPFGTFEIPPLHGTANVASNTWAGHVAVVNVFASWCVPCKVEHPTLMKLSQHVKLYGIAWKDTPTAIDAYLKKYGNPYEKVAVDTSGKTTTTIGLSGVPETFLLDKNSIIRYHYKSVITEEIMNEKLLPLIRQLQETDAP